MTLNKTMKIPNSNQIANHNITPGDKKGKDVQKRKWKTCKAETKARE